MPEQEPQPEATIETTAPELQAARPISRRFLLGGGGALAASVVAASFVGWQRYRTLESGLGNPELAEQRIAGLFKADDPKGFAAAIAASFGAVVSVQGDVLRLNTKKV